MAGGDEVDDEATACEACSRTLCSATNAMLLCDADGCQNAYHMRCLKPSLASVPEGEWICPKAAQPLWKEHASSAPRCACPVMILLALVR